MSELDDLFTQLRPILERDGTTLVVVRDRPGDIQVETTKAGPSGTHMWFGAVQQRAEHVSVHLMPLVSHPDLIDGVSDDLRSLLLGRSCFNFTPGSVSPERLEELAALIDAGVARYRRDGLA